MSETLRTQEKDDFDLVVHGSPEHVSHSSISCMQRSDNKYPRSKHFGTRTLTMKSGIASSKKNIQISQPNSNTYSVNWMLCRRNFI